ncbi:unnamed protein product, partial [Owenia fusiformis]
MSQKILYGLEEHLLIDCINVKLKQNKFEDCFDLLKNGCFVELKREALRLWDAAHYKKAEFLNMDKEKLTSLKKYRIRQRFPPPRNICPTGERPSQRLPLSSTDILRSWVVEHSPYPTTFEKHELAKKAKITVKQVSSWCLNYRKRKKKRGTVSCENLQNTTNQNNETSAPNVAYGGLNMCRNEYENNKEKHQARKSPTKQNRVQTMNPVQTMNFGQTNIHGQTLNPQTVNHQCKVVKYVTLGSNVRDDAAVGTNGYQTGLPHGYQETMSGLSYKTKQSSHNKPVISHSHSYQSEATSLSLETRGPPNVYQATGPSPSYQATGPTYDYYATGPSQTSYHTDKSAYSNQATDATYSQQVTEQSYGYQAKRKRLNSCQVEPQCTCSNSISSPYLMIPVLYSNPSFFPHSPNISPDHGQFNTNHGSYLPKTYDGNIHTQDNSSAAVSQENIIARNVEMDTVQTVLGNNVPAVHKMDSQCVSSVKQKQASDTDATVQNSGVESIPSIMHFLSPFTNNTGTSLINNTNASLINISGESLINNADESLINNTGESLINNADESLISNTGESLINNTGESLINNIDESLINISGESLINNADESLI